MKGIFVGTVEISWHCLKALLDTGVRIDAVYTMPPERADRIAGFRSFEDICAKHGVPLHHESDVNQESVANHLEALDPDIGFVIGWPRIIQPRLLNLPRNRCVGFHSSLLPKYRGSAPVNWGLIEGATEWGGTLMHLGEGVDTGDIIGFRRFPVSPDETCADVYDKVTEAAVELIREYVPRLADGSAPRVPQDEAQATIRPRRRPHDGLIQWTKPAGELHDWVRALTHPYPGAFTFLPDGRRLFVWKAELPAGALAHESTGQPGRILGHVPYEGVSVQTGQGALLLRRVQIEGEPEMSAGIWFAHDPGLAGTVLDAVADAANGVVGR